MSDWVISVCVLVCLLVQIDIDNCVGTVSQSVPILLVVHLCPAQYLIN